jgi:hypothetical protein
MRDCALYSLVVRRFHVQLSFVGARFMTCVVTVYSFVSVRFLRGGAVPWLVKHGP